MTVALNITHEQVDVTEYRWTVPAQYPIGAVVGELKTAYAMAETEAKQHGIDTSYDDWLRVRAEDDQIVMFFAVKKTSAC